MRKKLTDKEKIDRVEMAPIEAQVMVAKAFLNKDIPDESIQYTFNTESPESMNEPDIEIENVHNEEDLEGIGAVYTSFTTRTSIPKSGNKNYITKSTGGWSPCIKGNPTYKECNTLANCVGYANGRFNEIYNGIMGTTGCKFPMSCNAENFIEAAKKLGLEVGSVPRPGAIMVWQGGSSLKGSDGAGHVEVVELVYDNNNIYTSSSGWGSSKIFWNTKRNNNNGRWGLTSGYKFRGFIYNPAVKESEYIKGIYKCNYNMYIRENPNGRIKKVKECTSAMRSALTSNKPNDNAIIKKGKQYTALDVVQDGNGYWAKNYSGYICIDDGNVKYCTRTK